MEVKIEVDADMRVAIKNRVVERLVNEVVAQFDTKQLAAEVKNQVIGKAVQAITPTIEKQFGANEVIERSVKSIENRINAQIAKTLKNGITIKLDPQD